MKLKEFSEMLRKIVREEVQLAVRKEIKTLTESTKPTLSKGKSTSPTHKPQRTSPIVTLDSPFGMDASNPIGALLQETANAMAGHTEHLSEANPDFPLGNAGTDMFVKDYSAVLKRSEEIR
jgi:hypothetical protein